MFRTSNCSSSGRLVHAVLWYLFTHQYKQSGRCQDGYRCVLTWGESGWGILPSTRLYRVFLEEMSIFWEVIVSVILSKKVYMYMCSVPNGFRDRAVSLYSYKIIDKEISPIVSNNRYLFFKWRSWYSLPSKVHFRKFHVNINALLSSCEDMACCSSECILTYLYAGDNIQYEIQQFVSCIHFCSVHFTLHPVPQTKI
jgi:hypothetical protein